MATIAKIRRLYFQDKKSIRQIYWEWRVALNMVWKMIRSGVTKPTNERTIQHQPKIGPEDMMAAMKRARETRPLEAARWRQLAGRCFLAALLA
ncbi:hypothetical protein KUV57_13720 [Epibacterium sp. DP7N7-1]|nr:hypothetical protein [Epibacterium sp. DP7N7-1]